MKNMLCGGKRFPIWVLGCLFGVILIACNQKVKQPTIPEDKMVRLMADLVIADAATSNFSGYPKDSLAHIYYQQVFDMHQVTLQQYEENLRIYTEDVDKMEEISKKVEEIFAGDKAK